MPLRTVEQYKESLKDDRLVYFRGQRLTDVTQHPLIQIAIDHEATDYRLMHDPEFRDLAVVHNPDTGEEMSRYFLPPQNAEQLLKRSEFIPKLFQRCAVFFLNFIHIIFQIRHLM